MSLEVDGWRADVLASIGNGARFAGLYGVGLPDGCRLNVLLGVAGGFDCKTVAVRVDAAGELHYPALSTQVPAAFWYERALHDLSGVVPDGHPRLDPLLLPLRSGADRPRPGLPPIEGYLHPEERVGPVDVTGHGMFTIPYGPVRSGVSESIELLVETPGEDIPHLNIRPHYKHRGIAKRFEGRDVFDAVLVAERVEGICSVAHALAFSHAVETGAQLVVPERGRLLRVVYAELERISNHLDVAMRLCDAAGLAVATARMSWHKEIVMRLLSAMCGSRFGRGVVVPGGVAAPPLAEPMRVATTVSRMASKLASDVATLMTTASFLDRIRGTGRLDTVIARAYGALGPIGRASGAGEDDRVVRGYDAYPELVWPTQPRYERTDALSRLNVRWAEIETSVRLIAEALARLRELTDGPFRAAVEPADGFSLGWAESPQGEVLYGLDMLGGRVQRCFARSASFHNLVLFHDVFNGDVFTDFAFIEASFGLCYAGVAM